MYLHLYMLLIISIKKNTGKKRWVFFWFIKGTFLANTDASNAFSKSNSDNILTLAFDLYKYWLKIAFLYKIFLSFDVVKFV